MKIIIALGLLFVHLQIFAQDSIPDKSIYNIFNPTPKQYMRDMYTDRPDVVEAAFTVDAGHFQYEGDLINRQRVGRRAAGDNNVLLNNGIYKMGITNHADFEIAFASYIFEDATGERPARQGLGDVTFIWKQNIFGNDKNVGLAVMTLVKMPVNSPVSNGLYEYGLIFPFTWEFAQDWELGLQYQLEWLRQQERPEAFYVESVYAAVISGPVIGPIDFFVEGVYIDPEYEGFFTANGGIMCHVTPNVMFDTGVNIGLNHYAYSRYFLGFSFRI